MSAPERNSSIEYNIDECLHQVVLKFQSDKIENSYVKQIKKKFTQQIQLIISLNLVNHAMLLICLLIQFDTSVQLTLLEIVFSVIYLLFLITLHLLCKHEQDKGEQFLPEKFIYSIQAVMFVADVVYSVFFTNLTDKIFNFQEGKYDDTKHRQIILMLYIIQTFRYLLNQPIYHAWFIFPTLITFHILYTTIYLFEQSATFYLAQVFAIAFLFIYFYNYTKESKYLFFQQYTKTKELKGWKILIDKMIPMPIYVVKYKEKPKVVFSNNQSISQFKIRENDDLSSQLRNIHLPYLNKNMEEVLKHKVQKHTGQNILTKFTSEEYRRQSTNYRKIFHYFKPTGEENYYDSVISNASNQKQYYDIKLIECTWQYRKAYMLIFHNVDQKMLRIKQEKISKFKSKILSQISHDLKTPLNGIILQIESCIANNFQDVQQFAQDIKNNSFLLMYQINKLVDFARLQNQQFVIYRNEFIIRDLLEEVKGLYYYQAQNKGIQLIVKYPENVRMVSDRMRILQMLTTLLDNSFKFTFFGKIELLVSVSSENENHIIFQISDTGIGIPHDRIIELFSMIKGSDDFDLKNGFGFGLPYCKQIIHLIGPHQKIYLKSKPNEGTEIRFLLYRKLPDTLTSIQEKTFNQALMNSSELQCFQEQEAKDLNQDIQFQDITDDLEKIQVDQESQGNVSDKIAHEEEAQRVRTITCWNLVDSTNKSLISMLQTIFINKSIQSILIVDDMIYNIIGLRSLFQQMTDINIDIDEVHNGQQALDNVKKGKHYDLIFMDVNMPVMDGFAATRKIKDINPNIKILIVTAFTDANDQIKCSQSGADAYMQKPVSVRQLIEQLEQY